MMNNPHTDEIKEKFSELYDKFAAKSRELYEAGVDKGHDAMQIALEKSREHMTALGELTAEQGRLFEAYMKRDLEQTVGEMNRLGEKAKEHLHPSRVGAGALSSVASMLQYGGDALWRLSKAADQALIYKTGEITSAGTLTCLNCLYEIHMKATDHISPCPKCRQTTFKKSY